MLETSVDGTHSGWTVVSRSAREIEARIAVAQWGDGIAHSMNGDPSRQYRYYVIRYRTDAAYIDAYQDILTTPKYSRFGNRNRIRSHPACRSQNGLFDVRARTRLGRLG